MTKKTGSVPSEHARLAGGWGIDYVHGNEATHGYGLHVLRVFGDITRPKELRQAIERWRTDQGLIEGPTILHSPLGVMARWEYPNQEEPGKGGGRRR